MNDEWFDFPHHNNGTPCSDRPWGSLSIRVGVILLESSGWFQKEWCTWISLGKISR